MNKDILKHIHRLILPEILIIPEDYTMHAWVISRYTLEESTAPISETGYTQVPLKKDTTRATLTIVGIYRLKYTHTSQSIANSSDTSCVGASTAASTTSNSTMAADGTEADDTDAAVDVKLEQWDIRQSAII